MFRKIKNKIKKYFKEYVLALRSNDPSQKRIIFESFRIVGFSLIFLSVIIWLEIKKPEIFFDAEFDIRNPKILLTLILADLVLLCLFGLISWILCKKVFNKAFEKVLNSVKVALVKLSGIHPSRKEGIFVSLSVVLIGVLLWLLAVQFTLNNKIKEKLVQETKANRYISRERFVEICQDNDVNDQGSQQTLLQYLNDLGVVLYFKDVR